MQPLNGHEPYIVSSLRNVLDVNIFDKVTVTTASKAVNIKYSNFKGETANAEP